MSEINQETLDQPRPPLARICRYAGGASLNALLTDLVETVNPETINLRFPESSNPLRRPRLDLVQNREVAGNDRVRHINQYRAISRAAMTAPTLLGRMEAVDCYYGYEITNSGAYIGLLLHDEQETYDLERLAIWKALNPTYKPNLNPSGITVFYATEKAGVADIATARGVIRDHMKAGLTFDYEKAEKVFRLENKTQMPNS